MDTCNHEMIYECVECSICMETITKVNVTTTTCGHTFHSSCLFENLRHRAECPFCRVELVKSDDDSEDDSEDDSDYEGEDDDSNMTEENNTPQVSMEQIAKRLSNMGYTMADLVFMMIQTSKTTEDKTKYTEDYVNILTDKVYDIWNGDIAVDYRDNRSYATVVVTPSSITELNN